LKNNFKSYLSIVQNPKLLSVFSATLFVLLIHTQSHAQQWLGISGSNYAGTQSIYNNPANLSDSRYKLYVNLVANDIFLSNNYEGWNAPYSILQLLTNSAPKEYRNAAGVTIFKNSYYDINTNGEPFHLNLINDLRGPSALFSINNKRAIAVLTRIRTGVNLSNVTSPLANLIRLGTDTLLLKNQDFNLAGTTLNLNGYAELGIAYSQILKDEDEDFVKIGFTVKRVVGIYNAHLNIQEADYNIINDPSEPKKQLLRVNDLKANYGYTRESAYKNASASYPWGFGNQSAGSGWGLDLGLVYEFRPEIRKYAYREKGVQKLDPSKNKYEFRLGVSILDIGGINYNNPYYVRNWEVNTSSVTFNSTDISRVEGSDDLFNRINTKIGSGDLNSLNNFTSCLPTVFQVNLDYHLRDKFYVNSQWVQNLRGSQSIGMKMPSSLSITPRWESKWIEIAMPFALLDNYNTFTFGLATRLGPLFLGTDNLGTFLNINHPRGADLYFGLSIPIFNRPPTLPNACFYEKDTKRGLRFWKKRNR
jgi:Family of unknown function (DUF5723)